MKTITKILKYFGLSVLLLGLFLFGYIYSLTFTQYGRMDWRQAAFAKFVSLQKSDPQVFAKMTDENMPPVKLIEIGSFQTVKITPDSLSIYIYKPKNLQANSPIVIHYHGGGFVGPFNSSIHQLARQYANHFNMIVVSVDYRIAPKHPFPTAIDDSYNAFKWVISNAKNLGGNPDKIVVIGESAGGNIATVIAQKAKNEGITNIKYQVLICPTTDAAHTFTYPSFKKFGMGGYLFRKETIDYSINSYTPNESDLSNPEVSPLLAKSLGGLPTTYIITTQFDPLHDEGEVYSKRMIAEGVAVKYRDMQGFLHCAGGPGMEDVADKLQSEIAIELQKALK